MSRATRIHHVTVMVTDLDKADAFYGGVIGLPKIPRPDFPSKGIWYEIDGTHVHIILAGENDSPSARHIAFVVDDLQETLSRVQNMGLPIWSDIQLDGWVRKQCRDPFGNGVELLQLAGHHPISGETSPSYVTEKGQWQIGEAERS